jgi:hypothetical protein
MTGDQTRPADTASPAAIVNALYECISGEAGQERQWTREAGLLHPDARLMRTGIDDDGTSFIKVLNADEYRSNTEPFFAKNAFWEVEIDRREWRFGNIAHVLSLYEARTDPQDPVPERRGINSIQLYHDGDRWWVLSVLWDNERPGLRANLDHYPGVY